MNATSKQPRGDELERAVVAARAIGVVGAGDVRATLLYRTDKTVVVRLRQTGRADVIIKRKVRPPFGREARVYQDLLVDFEDGHVDFLGTLTDPVEGEYLALGDAGDLALDQHDPGMRASLGRLLGAMARHFSSVSKPDFPEHYTHEHHHGLLEWTHDQLTQARRLADSTHALATLDAGGRALDKISAQWPAIGSMYHDSPTVLCHADVKRRNVRFCPGTGGLARPVLVDWELAGWGPVGLDLGSVRVTGVDDPLITGLAAEALLDPSRVLEWARLARLLRMVACFAWDVEYLPTVVSLRGIERIEAYNTEVDRVLAVMSNGDPRGDTSEAPATSTRGAKGEGR